MGELQTLVPKLEEIGYQIVAVSPDTPEKAGGTVEAQGLSFQVLTDSGLIGAQAMGIAFKQGKRPLPVPSIFIVGKDRVIRFEHIDPDFTQRLDTEALLALARASLK